MALPLPTGLTPPEIAFLCEMELVTVIPRQRLESLHLLGVSRIHRHYRSLYHHSYAFTLRQTPQTHTSDLSLHDQGPTPILRPPHRMPLPLWLALLLKRQRRADIVPPAWLQPAALSAILERETNAHTRDVFSQSTPLPPLSLAPNSYSTTTPHPPPPLPSTTPPFLPSMTADASAITLPYHWLEVGQTLLAAAADDVADAEAVRRLLRDLREVRLSKLRAGVGGLSGGSGVKMNGVGAMEVGEWRGFWGGVVDGLRVIGASREGSRREVVEEDKRAKGGGGKEDEDVDATEDATKDAIKDKDEDEDEVDDEDEEMGM